MEWDGWKAKRTGGIHGGLEGHIKVLVGWSSVDKIE